MGKFSVLARLSEYKPTNGALGPRKPKQVLGEVDVSRLLHRPRSELVELWKRGNSAHRSETLDEGPNSYRPSGDTRNRVDQVILPGGNAHTLQRKGKSGICSPWVLFLNY